MRAGAAATAAGAPGLAALGAVVAVTASTVRDVAAVLGAGVAAIAGSPAFRWVLLRSGRPDDRNGLVFVSGTTRLYERLR